MPLPASEVVDRLRSLPGPGAPLRCEEAADLMRALHAEVYRASKTGWVLEFRGRRFRELHRSSEGVFLARLREYVLDVMFAVRRLSPIVSTTPVRYSTGPVVFTQSGRLVSAAESVVSTQLSVAAGGPVRSAAVPVVASLTSSVGSVVEREATEEVARGGDDAEHRGDVNGEGALGEGTKPSDVGEAGRGGDAQASGYAPTCGVGECETESAPGCRGGSTFCKDVCGPADGCWRCERRASDVRRGVSGGAAGVGKVEANRKGFFRGVGRREEGVSRSGGGHQEGKAGVVDADLNARGKHFEKNKRRREEAKLAKKAMGSFGLRGGSGTSTVCTVDTRTAEEIEASRTLAVRRTVENRVAARLAEHKLAALCDNSRTEAVNRLAAARYEQRINGARAASQKSFKQCDNSLKSLGSTGSAGEFALKQAVKDARDNEKVHKYVQQQLALTLRYVSDDVKRMVAELPEPTFEDEVEVFGGCPSEYDEDQRASYYMNINARTSNRGTVADSAVPPAATRPRTYPVFDLPTLFKKYESGVKLTNEELVALEMGAAQGLV